MTWHLLLLRLGSSIQGCVVSLCEIWNAKQLAVPCGGAQLVAGFLPPPPQSDPLPYTHHTASWACWRNGPHAMSGVGDCCVPQTVWSPWQTNRPYGTQGGTKLYKHSGRPTAEIIERLENVHRMVCEASLRPFGRLFFPSRLDRLDRQLKCPHLNVLVLKRETCIMRFKLSNLKFHRTLLLYCIKSWKPLMHQKCCGEF